MGGVGMGGQKALRRTRSPATQHTYTYVYACFDAATYTTADPHHPMSRNGLDRPGVQIPSPLRPPSWVVTLPPPLLERV